MKKIGIPVLRVVIGLLFMGHGLQKLKGWFGGGGIDGTAKMFDRADIAPPRESAILAGAAETTAGALLTVGFLTPLASSMVTGVMAQAIRRVHLRNGPWVTKGGYEYNAVLMAAVFAITAEGPGALSLDRRLRIERGGNLLAMAQLATGLAGAGAMELVSRAAGRPASETATEQPATPQPSESRAAEATPSTGPEIDLRRTADPAEAGPIIPNPTITPTPR